MTLGKEVILHNGIRMPAIGLGVWKMAEGAETKNAVAAALAAGYRHIDTAKLYGNERSVGSAVRESGIPRNEIFVTTKLWPTDFFDPQRGFEESLKRLDIAYVDLYLIHWPVPLISKKPWQILEKIYESGLAKSIGVSNYSEHDIEKVLSYAKIAPMVNQIEFNPKNHDFALVKYCASKNIVVEAYSPLGRGGLIRNRTVIEIAQRYKKTPAQILIRWALEHGTVPLPKSSNPQRIASNLEAF
ncbi:MAG: aldo/keto reductase, partial [Patescibacteria group bacterium]|nr:aldo/keto reductase [Patescibacteria group bacterium]